MGLRRFVGKFFSGSIRTPNKALYEPNVKEVEIEFQIALSRFMEDVEDVSIRIAEEETPIGATEELITSIQFERPTRFEGALKWTAPHAAAVAFGARPHWPPIGPVRLWAAVKLGDEDLAYPIQHSIAARGTLPNDYQRRTSRRVNERVGGLFQDAISKWARRIG